MRQIPTINNTERKSKSEARWVLGAWFSRIILGLCLVNIGQGFACIAPVFAEPSPIFSLVMHKERVSAQIIGVPLERVLATLTRHRPFRFDIKGSAKNDVISSSFHHLSFKESLETLLLGHDYAIIHRPLDPTLQTSETRFLMEVVVFSRNLEEPSSGQARPSLISREKVPAQPVLLQTSPINEKPSQPNSLGIGGDKGEIEVQSIVEEALQDADPDSLVLLQELLQE